MKKNVKHNVKRDLYALYQGAIMCRVISTTIKCYQKVSMVVFDNGEIADVPFRELQLQFDL